MRLVENELPDLIGDFGAAWRHDLQAIARSFAQRALTVSSWIVQAPNAHPIWTYYWIGCVSLRDTADTPPARIILAGATHEVMVYAINPDHEPAIDEAPALLTPANFHGQFIAGDDTAAAAHVRETVVEILQGRLSPDSDALREWIRRYSDSNLMMPRREPGDVN
jgi:hypothetical protein